MGLEHHPARRTQITNRNNAPHGLLLGGYVIQRKPTMTTIVLAHPNHHCPRFQVFGVYDGDDDRFVFGVNEFEDRDKAERVAHWMMEKHGADHFKRVVR